MTEKWIVDLEAENDRLREELAMKGGAPRPNKPQATDSVRPQGIDNGAAVIEWRDFRRRLINDQTGEIRTEYVSSGRDLTQEGVYPFEAKAGWRLLEIVEGYDAGHRAWLDLRLAESMCEILNNRKTGLFYRPDEPEEATRLRLAYEAGKEQFVKGGNSRGRVSKQDPQGEFLVAALAEQPDRQPDVDVGVGGELFRPVERVPGVQQEQKPPGFDRRLVVTPRARRHR